MAELLVPVRGKLVPISAAFNQSDGFYQQIPDHTPSGQTFPNPTPIPGDPSQQQPSAAQQYWDWLWHGGLFGNAVRQDGPFGVGQLQTAKAFISDPLPWIILVFVLLIGVLGIVLPASGIDADDLKALVKDGAAA